MWRGYYNVAGTRHDVCQFELQFGDAGRTAVFLVELLLVAICGIICIGSGGLTFAI
jgi:hypothetical protein